MEERKESRRSKYKMDFSVASSFRMTRVHLSCPLSIIHYSPYSVILSVTKDPSPYACEMSRVTLEKMFKFEVIISLDSILQLSISQLFTSPCSTGSTAKHHCQLSIVHCQFLYKPPASANRVSSLYFPTLHFTPHTSDLLSKLSIACALARGEHRCPPRLF